jgi:hypothetical protein
MNRATRAAPLLCLAVLLVGCRGAGGSAHPSVAPETTVNAGGCARDPVQAAKTFLAAVKAGDSVTSRRCDHEQAPPSAEVMRELASSPWLLDSAARTDQVSPPTGPDQVAVRVPLPDEPRPNLPPHQSGVTITTTLDADGSYYVTAVQLYVST